MQLRRTAPAAVTALTLALGLAGATTAAARQTADERTAVRQAPTAPAARGAQLADARPGDVLKSAPTSFHPLPGQVTNTRAWHIEYRSTDAKGAPDVVSGTVIVPKDGRTGPRPLVSYAVGTVGLADSCAPSAGFPYGTTVEANLIQQLTARGWAVAVTDYEGLGTPGEHTYSVGRSEGQAVLDAARAAQRLPEAAAAGVTKDSPVGLMGYSQGGQASGWAAELHDSYAPELKLRGTAAGGVPADLIDVADFNDGNIGAGLILMAAIGQDAAFPELDLAKYLNAKGRFYVDFLKKNCVAIDVAAGLFKKISDVTVRNPLSEADWQRRVHESDLGGHRPDAPVYLYHGTLDELIPYTEGTRLRARWCGRGGTVQWSPLLLSEHVGGAVAGAVPAANWLADRFAGRPADGNCR
ncbi:lipase family protein [Streptomyces sp. MST-110588]|uniref:lipase family protein n=1 Tax=Streptomyces sp. MST-110588 TaxID=2833628 RepID=UPI001F5CF84D|nr:lipase family protein [Streptomyces sp. MST-110588]UNO41265.1 prolyl oligopeptidase family serine peptidase [Streptomyces sp. MST-110588]